MNRRSFFYSCVILLAPLTAVFLPQANARSIPATVTLLGLWESPRQRHAPRFLEQVRSCKIHSCHSVNDRIGFRTGGGFQKVQVPKGRSHTTILQRQRTEQKLGCVTPVGASEWTPAEMKAALSVRGQLETRKRRKSRRPWRKRRRRKEKTRRDRREAS